MPLVNVSFTDIQAIDSVGVPPLPIPNREVKPNSADGTAKICGRVGHRRFLQKDIIVDVLFLYIRQAPPLPGNARLSHPARLHLRRSYARLSAARINEPAFGCFVGE